MKKYFPEQGAHELGLTNLHNGGTCRDFWI